MFSWRNKKNNYPSYLELYRISHTQIVRNQAILKLAAKWQSLLLIRVIYIYGFGDYTSQIDPVLLSDIMYMSVLFTLDKGLFCLTILILCFLTFTILLTIIQQKKSW